MQSMLDDINLKNEVKKLSLNDLKDLDDIFEHKEIKLSNNTILEDCNYEKLKKAKIKAQLFINNFYNHDSFSNCIQLMDDESIAEDIRQSNDSLISYYFVAKPNQDEVTEALYEYALSFLKTQQAEIRDQWKNFIGSFQSVDSDMFKCSLCESKLTVSELTCSVCSEPIINTIQELMSKRNLEEKLKLYPAKMKFYSDKNSEYLCENGSDNHEFENGIGLKNIMSDEEMNSRRNSKDMIDSTTYENNMLLSETTDTSLHGNCIGGDESLRESYETSGDKQQYWQQCQVHETMDSDICNKHLGNCGASVIDCSIISPGQQIRSNLGDNKCCSNYASETLGELTTSDNRISPRESPLSGDMSMMPDIKAALEVDLNGKWPCKMCGLLNEQSFLSCVACSAPRMATWTCQHCSADNKISTKKCAVCDHDREDAIQRRYCTACRDNEVVTEGEICADCLETMWLCWRSVCHGVNYGSTQYCGHCGVDKAADRTPGASIRILKDGARVNDDGARDHRCGHCHQAANSIGDSGDDSLQYEIINGVQPNTLQQTRSSGKLLYPSLPESHQEELWTCNNCQVDNMMTSMQCVACESSRFCRHCKIVHTVREGLCADCLRSRWQCWYRACEHVNFNRDNAYCEKCGLAKQAPGMPGESVLRYIYGRPQQVWVCDRCQRINQNNHSHCSNYTCRVPRNANFIWCQFCGWGNIRTWSDFILGKCGRCDTYF